MTRFYHAARLLPLAGWLVGWLSVVVIFPLKFSENINGAHEVPKLDINVNNIYVG